MKGDDCVLGNIVTIIVDNPYGVEEKWSIKNEIGVIVDFEESTKQYKIATGNYKSDGYWFTENEFRPATDDECRAALYSLIMKGR